MAVQITPNSAQHTGMAVSVEGSVAAWHVTFDLDGDESSTLQYLSLSQDHPRIMKLNKRHSKYYRSF
jgi:hypothetical protein